MSRFSSIRDLAAAHRTTVTEGPGGVPMAFVANPTSPSAAYLLAFRDGVAYETAEQWGISHFLEHAVFRGTTSLPSLGDISRRVEGVGGAISAYSTRELTAFFVRTPPGRDQTCLDVLARLLTESRLDPADLAAERAIIQQERMRELANPALSTSLALESLLLAPDAAGRHPVGCAAVIDALDAPTLRRYLESHYHQGNLCVAAAGNLPEDVSALSCALVDRFAGGHPRERGSLAVPDPSDGAGWVSLPSSHPHQVHVAAGWVFPRPDGGDRYGWRILNTLLGAGYTSLLNLKLREELNIAYVVNTSFNEYRELATFRVNFALSDSRLAEGLEAVWRVLDGVRDDRLDPALVDAAIIRHGTHVINRLESSLNTAKLLGQSLCRSTPFDFVDYLDAIERVTAPDVVRLARAGFADEARRVVVRTGSASVRQLLPDLVALRTADDGTLVAD